MQVFKVYFKIISKHLPVLSIYFFIFLFFMAFLSFVDTGEFYPGSEAEFSPSYTRLMINNEDERHPLSTGLETYLSTNSNMVDIQNEPNAINDALFYQELQYLLTIPEGFGDAFIDGDSSVMLQKRTVSDLAVSVGTDMLIDRYLGMAHMYLVAQSPDAGDLAEISDMVEQMTPDLQKSTEIRFPETQAVRPFVERAFPFAYMSYSIIAIMILGVTTITSVFSRSDVRARTRCSPVRYYKMQMELFAGNLTFCLAVWALLSFLIIMLSRDVGLDIKTILLMVNALVFSIMSLSLAFFIGNVTSSRNAHHAIANVASLGMSFLGGVFVPQEFLGETVTKIARLTPTYWYVLFIEEIKTIRIDNWFESQILWISLIIQISFALAFLGISLVLSAQRRQKSI